MNNMNEISNTRFICCCLFFFVGFADGVCAKFVWDMCIWSACMVATACLCSAHDLTFAGNQDYFGAWWCQSPMSTANNAKCMFCVWWWWRWWAAAFECQSVCSIWNWGSLWRDICVLCVRLWWLAGIMWNCVWFRNGSATGVCVSVFFYSPFRISLSININIKTIAMENFCMVDIETLSYAMRMR